MDLKIILAGKEQIVSQEKLYSILTRKTKRQRNNIIIDIEIALFDGNEYLDNIIIPKVDLETEIKTFRLREHERANRIRN